MNHSLKKKCMVLAMVVAMLSSMVPTLGFAAPQPTTPVLANGIAGQFGSDSGAVYFDYTGTIAACYAVLLPSSQDQPETAQDVIEHPNKFTVTGCFPGTYSGLQSTPINFTFLAEDEDYHLSLVATNGGNPETLSNLLTVDFSTENDAPLISNSSLSEANATGSTLQFESDEAGSYYYIVVPDGTEFADDNPTAEEIAAQPDSAIFLNSENSSEGAAVVEAKGTGPVAIGSNSKQISGLVQKTKYDLYYVVKDASSDDPKFSDVIRLDLETTDFTLTNFELTADKKVIFVKSDVSLASLNKDNIKIKNGSATALLPAAFQANIINNTTLELKPAKGTFKATSKFPLTVQLLAGAVTTMINSDQNAAVAEKTLLTSTSKAFPKKFTLQVSSARDNKVLELTPDITGLTSPVFSLGAHVSIKDAITTTVDGKTFTPLGENDNVQLSNNKLVITFDQAITNAKTKLSVAAGVMRLAGSDGYVQNAAIKSAAFDLYPVLISAKLDPTNKLVSLKYSEPIVTKTPPATKGEIDTQILAKIDLDSDPINSSNAIINPTAVKITSDTIVATFESELTGVSNVITVEDAAVTNTRKTQDAKAYTSEPIVADDYAPEILGIGFSTTDKKITLYFDEPIFLNGTKTLVDLASGLKFNSDKSFTTATVAINKNTLVISHKTSDTDIPKSGNGNISMVTIPALTLRDAAGNTHATHYDSLIGADITSPDYASLNLSPSRKEVQITFNEAIYSVAKTIPLAAISILSGGTTKPITDAVWKTPTTTVSIVNGNVLRISGLKVALQIGDKVLINKDTLQDIALNKNTALEVGVYHNASDSMSMLNVAFDALSESTNILYRISELALSAADLSKTTEQRNALQSELSFLLSEINTIATTTTFDSQVLIGETPLGLKIAAGPRDNWPLQFTFPSATTSALGISSINVSTSGSAVSSLTAINSAIETLTTMRSSIATFMQQLGEAMNND